MFTNLHIPILIFKYIQIHFKQIHTHQSSPSILFTFAPKLIECIRPLKSTDGGGQFGCELKFLGKNKTVFFRNSILLELYFKLKIKMEKIK